MNLKQQIALNPRLLFWGRALVETKTLSAVIVLFYLHRGLGLDEVFYLSIVWSLTSLVTEVPSGYLTDHIGRKRTLLLGVLLLIVSQVLTFFSYGFYPFVLSAGLMMTGFKLASYFHNSNAEKRRKQEEYRLFHSKVCCNGSLERCFLCWLFVTFAQS